MMEISSRENLIPKVLRKELNEIAPGTFYYDDGRHYEGLWKNGQKHGKG